MISDAWEWFVEKLSEGWEEFIGLFTGMFSNLNEFSIPGLIAGGLLAFLGFIARNLIITPFTSKMKIGQGIATEIICYVAMFIVGYLMMKKAFDG